MTYGEFQQAFFQRLIAANIQEVEVRALWARWTEAHAGGRLQYAMQDSTSPLPEASKALTTLQRLEDHEPWAHILGHIEFAGIEIGMDRRALIPRPETEEVLAEALRYLPQNGQLLDWCTGSGCIALAAKHSRPDVQVEGWDYSQEALSLAKENALRTGLQVDWQQMNLEEEPRGRSAYLDVLVSNPPYIHPNEKALMDKSVTEYEPPMALYSPAEDSLHFYRQLASWAAYQIKPGGFFVAEIHPDYALDLLAIFHVRHGWVSSGVARDFCGKQRILTAQWAKLRPIFEE
ncbi:MAG: hypothetical protein ABR88_04405 [Cryomorphaceae bacterium BACL7 MAG-120322-bin74]|nr:MAG: hypothetical protein ABR88_04405 [Cryomorphaceae bacterium BACL7 MAG-120322-bin74]KRO82139.1 MAG: hypothetical protein ABR87_00080 [Cryomorphaceae bacterium BACL7 MAG-121220-bin83]